MIRMVAGVCLWYIFSPRTILTLDEVWPSLIPCHWKDSWIFDFLTDWQKWSVRDLSSDWPWPINADECSMQDNFLRRFSFRVTGENTLCFITGASPINHYWILKAQLGWITNPRLLMFRIFIFFSDEKTEREYPGFCIKFPWILHLTCVQY